MKKERQSWEDTVERFKRIDRKELIEYICDLEERLKKKNGVEHRASTLFSYKRTQYTEQKKK